MRAFLVLLLCGSAGLAHAKDRPGPPTPPPTSTSSTSSSSSSSSSSQDTAAAEAAIGYRIFGGHLGATIGSAAVAAAFATGSDAAPAAMGVVAAPMTFASMYTLAGFARRRGWNARVGSALAGMHPGFGYGALTGFMIAERAGLEGRGRRIAIFGLGSALSVITMGVWSRIVGRNLKKAMGLMYLLPLVGCLIMAPYAALAEKPRALGWSAVGMGAIALTVASFNTEF